MILRDADIHDLALLRHWDRQAHVVAADPNDDWQWERELQRKPPWRQQLIAELNGRPIGFVQIIDPRLEDSHYWGEISPGFRAIDIWIGDPHCLRKGYGSLMMGMAVERCFAEKEVHSILVDPLVSNRAAIRFYEHLGFKFVEERQFNDDHCAVYVLERSVLPRNYFKK